MSEPNIQQIRAWFGDQAFTAEGQDRRLAQFDAALAQELRAAEVRGAKTVADELEAACDEWEASGDDERLVNEVIDPLIRRLRAADHKRTIDAPNERDEE